MHFEGANSGQSAKAMCNDIELAIGAFEVLVVNEFKFVPKGLAKVLDFRLAQIPERNT